MKTDQEIIKVAKTQKHYPNRLKSITHSADWESGYITCYRNFYREAQILKMLNKNLTTQIEKLTKYLETQ